MPYINELNDMSCKVVDDNDESTLNDVITKEVDSFMCHITREYWAPNPQINLSDIFFRA